MSLNHLVSANPDTPELDISVKNLTVQSVNNLTPFGGLFMITSNGPLISDTTDEINLIEGASLVGRNQVLANGFEISSFHANYSGSFDSLGGGRTLALRIRSNGAVLAEFSGIQLTNAPGEFFETELDFSIRSLGGPGVASISTNIDFTYGDKGANTWRGERSCVVNSTTFDTTIDNELVITAQFSDADPDLNMQCLQAFVTRTF
jgi:hypothetical protein